MSMPSGEHRLAKIVADNEPVMIIHRLTGGYLWRWADAQLAPDIDSANPKLWRIVSEFTRGTNTVYRIQSHETTLYMTYPALEGGITWEEWKKEDAPDVEHQRWHIVPAHEGGFAFVPCYALDYALGIIGRVVGYGCGRPNKIPYCGFIPC